MIRLLLITVLTSLFTACGSAGENQDESADHKAEYNGLLMETDVDYKNGEAEVSIQVTNQTDRLETFMIADGHAFDIRLLDDEGNVQYDFAEDRMFTQAVISEELAPEETYQWTETLASETYRDHEIRKIETAVRIDEWKEDPVPEGELQLQKDWKP